jgi:hypothetical protein
MNILMRGVIIFTVKNEYDLKDWWVYFSIISPTLLYGCVAIHSTVSILFV